MPVIMQYAKYHVLSPFPNRVQMHDHGFHRPDRDSAESRFWSRVVEWYAAKSGG